MIKKIAFLVDSLFNERDFKRFGIEELRKEGFLVEIWSIYFLTNGHKILDIKPPFYCTFLFKKNDFIKVLDENRDNMLVINHISYNFFNFFAFKAICKRNIPYCVVHLGAVPISKKSGWKNIVHHLMNLSFDRFINKLFSLINYRLLKVEEADYALVGSKVDKQVAYMCGRKTKYIFAHSFDYETYLERKTKKNTLHYLEKHIVFLDEYGPFHPDLSLHNIKPLLNATDYYAELNKFFDYLELEFKLPVIIAAHPKSDYELNNKYFLDRPVIKNKTLELVEQSKFVLLHASTSVNFAVLNKKPLVFLTSTSYKRGIQKKGIMTMAKTFQARSIVDLKKYNTYANAKKLYIDELIYSKYLYDYVKAKEAPNVPLWQIFSQSIRNIT